MPSITIRSPQNASIYPYGDFVDVHPIFVGGTFDMSPYTPVRFGRGAKMVESMFCNIEVRQYVDGYDNSDRFRPVFKESIVPNIDMVESIFTIPQMIVRIPESGIGTFTIVAVMEIYMREGFFPKPLTPKFRPRSTTASMVASYCSDPVRFTFFNSRSGRPGT